MSMLRLGSISSYTGKKLNSSTTTATPILSYTTNQALWLDASNSSTLTLSGSTVTQWNDKSGNSRHAVIFTGSPTVVSSGINNLNCVYTTQGNTLLSPVAAGTFSNGVTMFIVYKYLSVVGLSDPGLISRSINNQPAPWDFRTTWRLIGNGFTNSNLSNGLDISLQTTPGIFICSISSTSVISSLLNGNIDVPITTLSNYSDSAENVYIGTRQDKGTNTNTYFGEIILYSSVLTDANIIVVEEYLKSKWGINYTSSVKSSSATITTSGSYQLYSFTNTSVPGTIAFPHDTTIQYLVVGGGGSGGTNGGGGGGGGGFLSGNDVFIGRTTYTIKVGKGGIGVTGNTGTIATTSQNNNSSGGNSNISISSTILFNAVGGGRGGNRDYGNAFVGGSGGGGGGADDGAGWGGQSTGASGIIGQGNSGGNGTRGTGTNSAGGGGGGAGNFGEQAFTSKGGNGAVGVMWAITGSYYGGGGGGGLTAGTSSTSGIHGIGGIGGGGNGAVYTSSSKASNGGNGTVNTGGGGGGGTAVGGRGGSGGSGIVIIAHQT